MADTFEVRDSDTLGTLRAMGAEDLMIEQAETFNYPWGKLYPRESFAELRYPEDVSFGEDNLIIYQALFACGTVAYLDDRLYYYFYNAEGITKSPWSTRSLQVFLGIVAQMAYYKANGYDRAYRKATVLYIQQCAHQIHRIREGKADLAENRPHLRDLKTKMRAMLRENREFSLDDHFYWYEALHPHGAAARLMARRVRRNLAENGIAGTLRKLTGRSPR